MAVDIGTLKGLLVLDDQFSSKLDVAAGKLQQTSKKWDKIGQQLTAVGGSLTRNVTLPLVAAGGAALVLSTKFETSLTKIETLVGIAGDEVAAFRDNILELSGETAKAPQELADALFVVTSAGARGTTALEILERAAKASAAGLGDTTDIARAVTSAITAYGEENLSASRATDILVATVREGNLEAGELAGSLGRVIGIASQVGVSFEQVGGFVATFTRLGVNAEEAVTSLRGVLAAAIAPTEGAAKGLEAMGTSAEELRRKIKEDGLDAALRDLVERAGDNTSALQAVIPNIRALSGVLGTAGAQGEQFARINENIANSLGILDEAFGRTTETKGFKFQQFLAELQAVGIRLGDALAPAFMQLLDAGTRVIVWLAKALELFTALPTPVQSFALALGLVAIALGPILLIGGQLALTYAALTGGMAALTAATAANTAVTVTNTTAQRAQGVAMLTSGSKLGKLINLMPDFLTKTKQARDAQGRFTTGFKVFDSSILKTQFTLKSLVTTIGTGLKAALIATATAIKTGVIAAFVALKAAAIAAFTVIAAHPFIALLVVLAAVTAWGLREGGFIFNAFVESAADGAGSIKELRGEWDKLGTTMAERRKSVQLLTEANAELSKQVAAGVEGAAEAQAILREQVALGEPAEIALSKITAATNDGTAASEQLKAAVIAGSTAINAAARAQAELNAEREAAAASAAELEANEKKLADALDAFGFGTADALTELDQLDTLITDSKVPTDLLAAAVLEIRDRYADLAEMSPEVAARLQEITDKMDPQALAAAEMAAALDRLNLVTFDSFDQEIEDLALAITNAEIPPEQLQAAIDDLESRIEAADFDPDEMGLTDIEEGFQKARLGAEGFTGVLPLATNAVNIFTGAAGKLPDVLETDPLKIFADTLDELGVKTVPEATKSLTMIGRAIEAGQVPTSELDRIVQELDEKYGELAKDEPAVTAALDRITEAAREQGAELEKDKGAFERFTDRLKEGFAGLADPKNIAGFIGSGIGSILGGDVTKGLGDIAGQIGGSIGGAVGSAFGPIGSIIGQQIGKLAGKLPGLIKGLFSKPEFKKVAKDVGRDLGVDISDELAKTIGERSKELGNRFAAVTESLPEIIAESGVASDKALGDFVARARDNLSLLDSGVFTSAEAFGNLGESLAVLIPEVDNLGASAERTDQIFEVLDAALGQVRTGLADTKDAAKLLGETFPLLVERLDEFGARGVMGIRSIIEQTRELGIEVEAVTDFVLQQTGKIVGGVDTILSSLRKRIDLLPEDLNFAETFRQVKKAAAVAGVTVGDAIVKGVEDGVLDPKIGAAVLSIGTQAQFAAGAIAVAFSEALAQGIPITQIVGDMQSQLGELSGIFTELGIEAPDSFKKISAFANKLAREDIAPVIEGVQGMGQAMEGLRDLGLATQTDFDAFGTSLTSAFDELTAGGFKTEEAFAAIGPQLQQLADLQRDFGFEVDAGTQALLDQASAAGVVKGAQLDSAQAVSAGFQGLFDRFDAFLEKQGIATDGMFNFGEQAADAMGKVTGGVAEAETGLVNFGTQAETVADQVNTSAAKASTGFAAQWDAATSTSAGSVQDFATSTSEALFGVEDQGEVTTTLLADQFEQMSLAVAENFNVTKDEAAIALEEITAKAELTGDQIEAALNRKFDITVDIDTNIEGDDERGDGDGEGRERGGEEFAGGTGPGGAFRNFGRGTRATLHGDEAVVTRGQGESIAAMVERAIGSGGGRMEAAGMQTIKLVVDGQVLTEIVLRNQSRVLSNKGLGLG